MRAAPENYRSELKDKAVLFGWVTGLLLLISTLMILSGPIQAYYLLRNVNSVFINNNDARRLAAHVPQKHGKADPFGYWFSMLDSEDMMFVFSVFKDGILIPLGAVVSADGSVDEVIPLSAHAVQSFDALPESVLQMYVRRIEKSNMEGKRQ